MQVFPLPCLPEKLFGADGSQIRLKILLLLLAFTIFMALATIFGDQLRDFLKSHGTDESIILLAPEIPTTSPDAAVNKSIDP